MSTQKVDGGISPAFLDDNEREAGRNGKPAIASLMAKIATVLNQVAHAGHPFFSWVVRNQGVNPNFRQVFSPLNLGTFLEWGIVLYLPHVHDPDGDPGFQAGQGIDINIGGTDYVTTTPYDAIRDTRYPEELRVATVVAGKNYSTALVEYTVSGATTNYPQLRAGSLWQGPQDYATNGLVGKADLTQKGEIIGERAGSVEHLGTFQTVFENTFKYQRPQIGWSATNPGTTDNWVAFTTSMSSYRYIFDQTYGAGGTSFTATTPAITFPLSYSSHGMSTQVRVYVFVYAAMAGTTNTGSIAVANKDASGTMASSPTALINGATINSTTFAWYPTIASFNPATAPYFLAHAGANYDRIALCAKSSGGTNSVRIAAYTLLVQPLAQV